MKADYYSMLEAWPTTSTEDIKKNYFRLAKLYHPDVAGDTPENKERFKLINEAFSVLSDPQKRQAYDESLRRGKKTGADSAAILEQDRRSATLAFTQAKDALKNGRYDKAALLLKSAIKYDPNNAMYNSWYGFSLAMLGTRLHEARDACKKALQVEFFNADYHANLGFVYFKAGLKNLAVKHFKDALKWDPDNPIASKHLELLHGSGDAGVGPIDRMVGAFKRILAR